MAFSWKKHAPWLIPLSMFLFAFALRLFYVNKGLFHHDVAATALILEQHLPVPALLEQGLFSLRFSFLFINYLLYSVGSLFGLSAVTVLHASSALFGGLSCVMLYVVGKKLFNQHVGVVSALLLSVTPIFLSVSTYGKEHTLQVFLFLSALALLLYVAKKPLWYAVSTGVLLSLFLLSKEDAFLFLPLFAYAYFAYVHPLEKKKLTALLLPVLVLFGSYFFLLLKDRIFAVLTQEDLSTGTWLGLFSSQLPVFFSDLLFTLTLLGFVLLLYGLFIVYRKDKKTFFFFILWLAYLAYYANNTVYSPRWLSLFLPAFLLLISYGITSIPRYQPKTTLVLGIVLFVWMFLSVQPILSERHQENHLVSYIQQTGGVVEPGSHIFVPGDSCVFFQYYLPEQSCSPNKPMNEVLIILAEKHQVGVSTYLIPSITRLSPGEEAALQELATQYQSEKLFTAAFADFHKASISPRQIELPFFHVTPKE